MSGDDYRTSKQSGEFRLRMREMEMKKTQDKIYR